jgi:alpha-L-arabinofuranosidase
LILKLVNLSDMAKQKTIVVAGGRPGRSVAVTTLAGATPGGMNSLEHPDVVAPVMKEMKVAGKEVKVELPAYSCVVVRVKVGL